MPKTKPKRFVMNLASVELAPELGERMKQCIERDPELRHVNVRRRRGPWLCKAIELLCDWQEEERAEENGKGGK